jgi:thioredoxin reductase (NADPH)
LSAERAKLATVTDAVIVGAGPIGLFQVFELGLLGLRAEVIDSLPHIGGQCSELYPDKPIYDIPAVPVCTARELIERLAEQIRPFGAGFHLGQEVTRVAPRADGRFDVETSRGTRFDAGSVIIAAGVGAFQSRRLALSGVEPYEGSHIHYRVKNQELFRGRDLVILGGGDSALDWALALTDTARSIVVVHRRSEFRAAPASVQRLFALRDAGRLDVLEAQLHSIIETDGALQGVRVTTPDGVRRAVALEHLLVFWGLHPKLGPIAHWGLALNKKMISVDAARFQTSIPGVFAVGDINDYPGKKKLILSGFHEAALAAFAVREYLRPGDKVHLQYTTTSPLLQRRLGVAEAKGAAQTGSAVRAG